MNCADIFAAPSPTPPLCAMPLHRPHHRWLLPALLALLLLQPRPAQARMPFIQVYHEWVVELEFAQIRSRSCRFGLCETDRLEGAIGQHVAGRQTICYLGYTSLTLPFALPQFFLSLLLCIAALFLGVHQTRSAKQRPAK